MPFDLIINATFAGSGEQPSGNLQVPAAWFTEWDWDETAVSAWDTDTTAGTQAELRTAIQTAMGQGTTASPQYHRIRWTGGNIAGSLDLTGVSASLPDFFGPHILVYSTDWTQISGSIVTGTSLSNVMFKGFEFRTTGGFGVGWIAPSAGNGRRMAIVGCRGGGHPDYANVSYTAYPQVWSASSATRWTVTCRNNIMRGMSEIFDTRAGTNVSLKHNFITGLRDDVIFQTTRNVWPYTSYTYMVGNVICDYADQDTGGIYAPHSDFVQHGATADGPNDEYYTQAYGNIMIGDTIFAYPVMASIIQQEGASRRHQLEFRDNIFLGNGTRGHWQPDRRFSLHRNMYLWPPLRGGINTSLEQWRGHPYGQWLRSTGTLGTDGDIDIGLYWAGANAQNTAGWGSLPNPAQVAEIRTLGQSNSYDTLFPNMTGLRFIGSTLIIDNGYTSVARNSQALRQWVSSTYQPAGGWEAAGFFDPAGWF